MGEAERGEAAPRKAVSYYCGRDHTVTIQFAVEATPPEQWDCPKCGLPASADRENPPPPPTTEVYKSHLAYVKERRSEEEGAALLDEAVKTLRSKRKSGEILF